MDMLLIIGVVVVFLLIPIFCVFYLLKFHKNDVKGIIRFNMKLKSDLPSFNKLFKSYLTKWSDELSDVKLITINSTYERQKSIKVNEIKKKVVMYN